MYVASVVKIKNVRAHSNADKVQLATCHGNQVVIGLDTKEDDLGVYFPSDGQLSDAFCKANNLYRDATKNVDPKAKPGMFDDNRRVRAQKFRGEISDGFWVPISNFEFVFGKNLPDYMAEGFEFDSIDNVPLCNKYVTQKTLNAANANGGKKTRAAKSSIMFKEHFDTAHFGKHVREIPFGKTIVITEKVHGTSGRIGHVQVDRDLTWFEKLVSRWTKLIPYEWKYLNGTRRVVISESTQNAFHDPTIREKAMKVFSDNLRKGETVYFEIVGFEPSGASIMPSVDIKKMKDPAFEKRWTRDTNSIMTYSYGCEPTQCEIYVYRMTLATVDGHTVDYTWEDVKARCSEMNVKHVPELMITTLDAIKSDMLRGNLLFAKHDNLPTDSEISDEDVRAKFVEIVEGLSAGASKLDDRHISEGNCVRVEGSGIHNKTFKYKTFEFKMLEGLIKDSGVVDQEEMEDNSNVDTENTTIEHVE